MTNSADSTTSASVPRFASLGWSQSLCHPYCHYRFVVRRAVGKLWIKAQSNALAGWVARLGPNHKQSISLRKLYEAGSRIDTLWIGYGCARGDSRRFDDREKHPLRIRAERVA
jgi:hypothetical protein